mmetsp:Transcript_22920/g.36651  ORF Transcript_22920/g.36651 Transcript_22920/m.36651 type:complete len:102 (-) Transcript_22920:82-387(-)
MSTFSVNLTNCLFAMVFAAATVGILNGCGVLVRTDASTCPIKEGEESGMYSTCEIWQDIRSILSFFLGAAVCWQIQQKSGASLETNTIEEHDKMQFSVCLI